VKKRDMLYSGKAKTVYRTDNPHRYIMEYRDDTSAFNAEKVEALSNKGRVNNLINACIMQHLEQAGIHTHLLEVISPTETMVKALTMIPIECVVRNYVTGSFAKRLGLKKGDKLPSPVFEFFYKNDALGDPLVNDSHILCLGWATLEQLMHMKAMSLKINDILVPYFDHAGMILADFKVEFGLDEQGSLCLGDEFTPDGCRVWDKNTGFIYDKDRFRQDMGGVVEAYTKVAQKLGITV
jgi:phosphoribosylaminoimidazole-succinocarboxamide synthase